MNLPQDNISASATERLFPTPEQVALFEKLADSFDGFFVRKIGLEPWASHRHHLKIPTIGWCSCANSEPMPAFPVTSAKIAKDDAGQWFIRMCGPESRGERQHARGESNAAEVANESEGRAA